LLALCWAKAYSTVDVMNAASDAFLKAIVRIGDRPVESRCLD